jgi:hypothetical protein
VRRHPPLAQLASWQRATADRGDTGGVSSDDSTSPENSTPDDADADPSNADEVFDLDHDGKISIAEDARARLGIVDARLEEIAHEPGLKGKLAETAHHLLDKLDND